MASKLEADKPLSISNHPALRLPGPSLLHQLVQTDPEEGIPAVDFFAPSTGHSNHTLIGSPYGQSRSISYRELHDASDILAARIWDLAKVDIACPKFIVPVLLPQGPELYIALLAILKAGGAFCPLNLDVPLERARFILDDVAATVVVTNLELADRIPTDQGNTILLHVDDGGSSNRPISSTSTGWRQPQPSDLAYVMYTSGSTGTPKGVGVSHEAASQSLLAHDRHIPGFDRLLQFAAPTFDVSVFEIFFPLFRGKTLVSCTRAAMLNDLPGVMREMRVDACELTPTVAGSLLRKRENVPGLILLLTIGEMLTKPVVEEFGGVVDGKKSILWAMYGPTEAAIHCTVQPAFGSESGVGNIGVPLDTVSAFILEIYDDEHEPKFRILPQGDIGELAVGGYQVAEGYVNRPEITAKAFIDTPYGRLYRTGDKARMRPDGTLECLGRMSEGQVKLRGQRIELGEIEHAALGCAGCHSAVAVVIRNILVLFCAVDEVDGVDFGATIQKSCREWLPGFMVPGDIVVMREFPRLPSGKVDRKGLVAGYQDSNETRGKDNGADMGGKEIEKKGLDEPRFRDELEEKLCRVGSVILGVEILPDQHLARAGVDSLVAIKLVSALREVGIEVAVVDVLASRTISVLCGRAKESSRSPSASFDNIDLVGVDIAETILRVPALKGLEEKEIEAIIPATPIQTAMLAETSTNGRAYCNWVELSFPPEHTDTTIVAWFLQLARENEALRTGFVHDGKRFLQVIFRELDASFATVSEALVTSVTDMKLSGLPAESSVKTFELSTEKDFLRPFRVQISGGRVMERTTVVMQIHHAVYDGWSMDMMLSNLETLAHQSKVSAKSPKAMLRAPKTFGQLPKTISRSLKALAQSSRALVRLSKTPTRLLKPEAVAQPPKTRPQFQQVCAYYNSGLFQKDCDAAREFWAENLTGFQPPPLPILQAEDRGLSDVASASFSFDVKSDDVRTALWSIDAGPQTIFQAALAWVWGALVGADDIVIGTVTSGRTIPVLKVQDIIGPCIATIPLRTKLSQVRTIQDLICSIHTANRAVLPHSVLPLMEIKRVAGLRPGQSIYDVVFVYQESLYSKPESSRTIKEVSRQDYLETKLLVEIEPKEDGFACRLTYHVDTFPEEQIKVLGETMRAVVSQMLKMTSDLSFVRRAFPPQLLSVYNSKPKTFRGVADLASAVEATVAKFPRKDALCFAHDIADGMLTTTTISFDGLNKMANQIAWLLQQSGVRQGDVVAIVMEKSVLLYAGILAILKVGCAYLSLLPSTPISRIGTIFRQAGVKVCVVDAAIKGVLEKGVDCELVDVQSAQLHGLPISNPDRTCDPGRVSYIIYTSGSTGVPKGVCVTQLNIMSNLDVLSQIYPVRDDSRLLQSCSQAFDVSVFEIFFAWTQGMCLCSATNDTLFADLEESIRRLGVTHLSMTPTVASLIDPANVPKVEFLVTSGEAMTEVVARKWSKQLYQGYGPSETTNICSVKKMDTGVPLIQHLGWSFENTSTVVLFRDGMEVVPFGCFGELCFGGDQIAKGYLNMEEVTAERFIDHAEYGRLYRSGDLGRMLPDGSMVISGRVDDQIKIRGQRVELGEIDAVVRGAGGVGDCATLFFKRGVSGVDRIVTYFVPKELEVKGRGFYVLEIGGEEGLGGVVREIYRELVARVPGYMLPSLVVPVSVLPVTPAGKLDRGRLRQVVEEFGEDYVALASHSGGTQEDDAPWSPFEGQIAEIISTVFGVEKVNIRRWTPLSTLGLDSISAIRVSKQIQERIGKMVAISTLLQNSSIAKLGEVICQADGVGVGEMVPKQVELVPAKLVESVVANLREHGREVEKVLPCTPLQEAMLAASTKNGSYLNKMLFRVNGEPGRVVEAWKGMCERHEILRTCFVSTEDARWPIVQVVLGGWGFTWLEMGVGGKSVGECVAEHGNTLPKAIDAMEPVVSFATIADKESVYLSFICHHALYDGVAVERLLWEVETVVNGEELPAPPRYERFLGEVVAMQSGGDGFWKRLLEGYSPKLVTGFDVDSGTTQTTGGVITKRLDMPLSEVNDIARQLGVSLLSVTQSAWAITLGCLFKTDDVCFGNVVSGRTVAVDRIDEIVAPCFNTIPIRMRLSGGARNVDLMKAFQGLSAEVIKWQFTPMRRIQAMCERRLLFDTLLLLQHPPRPLDQNVWSLERDDGDMDVPVVCELVPDTRLDLFTVKLHLERNRFPVELPGIILDLFLSALHSLLRYPDSHALLLDDVSSGTRERLEALPFKQSTSQDVAETSAHENGGRWTAIESIIRDVLSSLSSFPPDRIRRHTTIYQLGLDSISAVQIASMLRKKGLDVSASDVIGSPTCESLARGLGNRSVACAGREPGYDLSGFRDQVQGQIEAYGIAADTVEETLPCTPLQAGMMAQFIHSGGSDYFNYLDFQVDRIVALDGVVEGWRRLSGAHPILRTRLVPVEHDDCSFAMVQLGNRLYPLPVSSFGREQGSGFDLEKWRLDVAQNAANKSSPGQLWAVAVVDTEKDVEMHLAIHHCLYDAHSLQLLLADLARVIKGERLRTLAAGDTIRSAVVDILGQVSSPAGKFEEFWKSQESRTVINSFPVMTPLRESSRQILVESMTSGLSFRDLEQAVANSGYPIQVIVQAAWTRILASYLGESAVTFGVVLSGRNTEATQDAVFPCISTLPVIATNEESNHELLKQMLVYNTELFKQQHQPLKRIQHWLGLSNTRLFDTLLVYQKFGSDVAGSEVPWVVVNDQATVDYPVSIEVEPQLGDKLRFQITFFSDILPAEQARIILRQFDAVVKHLAFEPAGNEGDTIKSSPELFSILPADEPELPSDIKFLHQFVEVQAAKIPHRTALHFVDGFEGGKSVGREWTYEELNKKGNRVANLIIPYVKTGDLVAINFDKCPEAFFSILGVLKAGCSFVALDPGAPASRKQFIVQDSGASLILTSKGNVTGLGFEVTVPVVGIDEGVLRGQGDGEVVLSRELEESDVCYCLYTSGTTGVPKGCEITHENAVQCMLAFQKIFEGHWADDSRWLQFASLHFDVSVLEQYWSWSVGITLVGAPRDLILEDLAGTISKLGITHIDLTPSLARLVHPDDVPSLCKGVFITGGESLKQEILDVWGDKAVIYNFYGPTEATIGVTVYPRVPRNGRASNIGRQFVNVGTYVLKPGTERVAMRGGVGELCVSGKLVGKGYLRRGGLTGERFPVLGGFGDRVYRTGDLVRVLWDGCFDFLGRADDQVKLRGQRLEIGEINCAIRSGVGEVEDVATIVVRKEEQQKDFLVAFVVVGGEGGNGKLLVVKTPEMRRLCQRVRVACQERLPGYMVPTYILQLPFIPLSSNNKVEIKELRGLFLGLSQEELAPVNGGLGSAILSESGKKVARVIAAMRSLDVETITPASSVFELGIDSISVLRLARELRKEGLTHANPSTILRHPVMGELSMALDSQSLSSVASAAAAAHQAVQACGHRHRSHVCKELGVTPGQIEYIAPCSPLQLGMISRSAMDGAYFNTFKFRLEVGSAVDIIRHAWQRVVEEFPILRTMFVKTIDGFVQVALRDYEVPWEELDVSGNGVELGEVILSRWKGWVKDNEDNLVRPLELFVLDGGEGDGKDGGPLLVLYIFHGLYDANSFDIILDRVGEEYLAIEAGVSVDVGRIGSAPSFLEALCHGPLQMFTNRKPFWVDHLRGINFRPLAFTAGDETQGVVSSHREVLFDELEVLRIRLGVTHHAIIQAAWCWALSKHISADSTIGMIVSGRAIELGGAEKVVGPLFNTIPFHSSIRGQNLIWASLVRQCHEFNSAVLAFQHVPLRDIQKWCSTGGPLFDILFSFQIEEGVEGGKKRPWTEVHCDPVADYPLALEATLMEGNRLRLLIVANGGVIGEDRVGMLLDELEYGLGVMCRDEGGSLLPEKTAERGVVGNAVVPSGNLGRQSEVEKAALVENFTWTERATVLREEISKLADAALESVTENTSIFELGLDSIDVIKLSAILKQQGVKIKTSQLMKAQTIPAMLHVLDESLTNGDILTNGVSKPPSRSSGLRELITKLGYNLDKVGAVFPATPLQDSMMTEMVESDFQLYFNHDILEISPEADLKRLEKAWMTVIKGSPILRTTFLRVDASDYDIAYCQIVHDEPRTRIEEVEILEKEHLAKLVDAATQRARKGDGESDLLQLTVARAPDQTFLVLLIAHALYDGRSLDLIHQDVQAAYDGGYVPRQQYGPYLEEVVFTTNDGAPGFWSEFLDGVVPTLIPENGSGLSDEKVNRGEASSSVAAGDVKDFCKRQGITMQALGQACLAAIISTRTMSLDVTFGVVLSGRDDEYAENLMFPTINTVAMRSVLHGTVESWLRYMHENAVNVGSFQHFPLRKAQKLAGSGPLFNVLFIQQRRDDGEKKGGIMKSVDGSSAVEYPVCVEMEVGDGRLVWRTACEDRYVSREETSVLLHQLDVVMRFFIDSPGTDVITFSGESVSVCGLHEFVPRSAGGGDGKIGLDGEPRKTEIIWAPGEENIRQVLADVSGVPIASILKTHNIYNLGLDSISAMKVMSALRKEGIMIKFRDMLKAKSIGDMMKLVTCAVDQSTGVQSGDRSAQSDGVSVVAPDTVLMELMDETGVSRAQVQEVLPTTAMQVHMLSVWESTKGEVFFPEFKYRLTGRVDVDALGSAWERLVAETPILRTVFMATKLRETPVAQIILRPDTIEWVSSFDPSGDSKTWSYKPVGAFAQQPFNSLAAIKQTEGAWIIRLKIHHALYDAVSLPIMMKRFTELCGLNRDEDYRGEVGERPLTSAWSDMIHAGNTVSGKDSRQQFWTEYLTGGLSMPFNQAQSIEKSSTPRVSLIQPSAIKDISGLRSVCERNGVSIQALFLAAYAKFLGSSSPSSATTESTGQSRQAHNEDVVFGIYLANRADLEGTDGLSYYPTLCLVPLRVRIDSGKTLVEMAAQIQDDIHAISAPGNVGVGLWEIKEWTGVVVDSFVNFLSFPIGGQGSEGEGSDGVNGVVLEDVFGWSEGEVKEEKLEPGEEVHTGGYKVPPGLENIHVREAYVDAVDLEVSLQGDSMTIGVFGLGEKLGGDEGASKVVSSIVEILKVMVVL